MATKRTNRHLISFEITCFLADRSGKKLSARSIEYYEYQLTRFSRHLINIQILEMDQITPEVIRDYLTEYGQTHGAGGCHSIYRAVKVFCRWYERETDGKWADPIRKVDAPKVVQKPIPGVKEDEIKRMVADCSKSKTDMSVRDKAIILFLFDTGLRAFEFISLNVNDIDLESGHVRVKIGKGGKGRSVFIGTKTKRELMRYLRTRAFEMTDPLWVNNKGERLGAAGLRKLIQRHSENAGIENIPSAHDFRRGFATVFHRNVKSTIFLKRLMGHSSLATTERYIEEDDKDLADAHQKGGVTDNV